MKDLVTPSFWGIGPGGEDVAMAGPYPQEFREDVVAVARRRESGVTLAQVAKDFGISDATLSNWLRQTDVEEGRRPGVTKDEAVEVRELRRRNRLLEQENEVLRRAAAYLSQANLKLGGSPK
jgi:transposase